MAFHFKDMTHVPHGMPKGVISIRVVGWERALM